jgi:hypothetical protein
LRVPRGRDISSCDVVKQGCLILVELEGMKLRVSRGVSGEFLEGAWIGQCLLVLNDLRVTVYTVKVHCRAGLGSCRLLHDGHEVGGF